MNTALQRITLGLLVTIICGVVFHAPLSVGLGTLLPSVAVEIKAWKEILLALVAVLLVVDISIRKRWGEFLRDWVVRVAIAYSALHLLLLPFIWKGIQPVVAALLIDVRFVVFFVAVYAACRFYPAWRKPLIVGSVIAGAVSMIFAFLQVTVLPHDILKVIGYSAETIAPYLTVDQNYGLIRINSTLRGPNPLGLYAALLLTISLAALLFKSRQLKLGHTLLPAGMTALAVLSVIALWFSYSRSAKLAAIAAVGVVLACKYGRFITTKLWIALGISSLLLIGGVYMVRDVPIVSKIVFHEDPDEGGATNSNDGHWESLVDGTDRMLRQPLGAGIGSTGSPSLMTDEGLIIENYYLYVAHETGWLGLALFLLLNGLVLRRLYERRREWLACAVFASGLGIAVANLFLPMWADDTISLVWWGLAGVALAVSVVKEKDRSEDG